MRVAATILLATLALVAASCSPDTNNADEPAATDRPDDETAGGDSVVEAPPDAAEPAAEVEIEMFSFQPDTIEIGVGDTVRWTNRDATRHTVTAGIDAEPTGAFHVTFPEQGDRAALTFTEPGEYRYFCTPHPFMQGTVTVTG